MTIYDSVRAPYWRVLLAEFAGTVLMSRQLDLALIRNCTIVYDVGPASSQHNLYCFQSCFCLATLSQCRAG